MPTDLSSADLVLGPGDVHTIPAGVGHCPLADAESVVVVEKHGTVDTGAAGGERTAEVRALG